MWQFSAASLGVGIALGYGLARVVTPRRTLFWLSAAGALASVVAFVVAPDSWLGFTAVVAQVPTIGLSIANASALRS